MSVPVPLVLAGEDGELSCQVVWGIVGVVLVSLVLVSYSEAVGRPYLGLEVLSLLAVELGRKREAGSRRSTVVVLPVARGWRGCGVLEPSGRADNTIPLRAQCLAMMGFPPTK